MRRALTPALAPARRLALAAALGLLPALALLTAPRLAAARRPTTAELAEDGLTDPRKRPPPPRHRLRLALLSDAMRTSSAIGRDGKTTRFYYATLMLDLAYQVQVFKHLMIRPSFAIGGNVANSRQAMPGAVQPGLAIGYQGALLGVAAVYSVLVPFPRTIGANNGHGGPTQPVFLGLTPLARIVASGVSGLNPEIMGLGPIEAIRKALKLAGKTIDEIDLVEINEAFASVVLAWAKEAGADLARVNVNGGAIALGHPLGATGARLMTTLLHELERSGGRYGLQTMCEGGGQANVTIIERL